MSANPFRRQTDWRIDQQGAKESGEEASDSRGLARMQRPVESGRIIGNVKDDRMRVVRDIGSHNHVQDGTVVQDDRYELKDIDGDQLIVRIILYVKQRTPLHLVREIQVPPKLENYGVSSGSMQTCIAKGGSHWHSRHYQGQRGAPKSTRIGS